MSPIEIAALAAALISTVFAAGFVWAACMLAKRADEATERMRGPDE